MRAARNFALILGIGYTLLGIIVLLGLLLSPVPASAPDLVLDARYGYLFGLFPVNILYGLIQLAVGLFGLYVYFGNGNAIRYNRGVGILFAVLTIMGFIPVLNTTFGLAPLYSNDIWLNGLTALLGLYFGYVLGRQPMVTTRA